MVVGYPLGSTVAGLSAATLLELVGGAWQGMFWVGTGLSVLIALIAFALLPESVAFLHRKGTSEARQKASELARRLGLDDLGGDAPESVAANDTLPRSRLLGRDLWRRTVLLCAGYSLLTAGYYFVGTWTPKLVAKISDDAAGTAAGLCISVGTLVGAFVFGVLGMRFRASAFAAVSAIVGAVAVAVFAVMPVGVGAYALAVLLGVAVFGCVTSFTAASTFLYPIDARASSYGTMNGVGRLGAVLGPIIAGYAVDALSVRGTYLIATVLLVGAALAAFGIDRTARSASETAVS
ncbi:MAG: MFS transporter [Gordonia sp. (in: high G+C Gram-positive bacteria)]|uniref:MFS transporter n=1 Tax=Gordonia sp. (in: high G+C Gram-positive bacteria) TaxID=84139 RepID=UPI0039E6252C